MPQQVALTFDDGPWPDGTRQVLQALAQRGTRATFFVWGEQAAAHPDLVRATADAGHTLQPHCWAHTSHHNMSREQIRADLDKVLGLLRDLGVGSPDLWRPPWGHCRGDATRGLAAERGLELAGWTIDPGDYAGHSAATMYGNAVSELDAAAAGDGSQAVVLMHDCPLEPGQWERRQDVAQTVELVRRLTADSDRSFGPLAGGLDDHLDPARP